MPGQVLSSQWGDLSPYLLARIFPVEHVSGPNGDIWQPIADGDVVVGPLTDANLDLSLQWNSPFEAIGAESKLPLVSGLLQSGAGQSALNALSALVPDGLSDSARLLSDDLTKDNFSSALRGLEGAAGITRLNSTQIFSGMQPVKLAVTMKFRAWADPITEVKAPIDRLAQWASPQELSQAGFFESLAKGRGLIRSLFPSRAPQVLGIRYADTAILPVVIESMSQPLVAPRHKKQGARTAVTVQLSIATLAAIDQNDWVSWNVR